MGKLFKQSGVETLEKTAISLSFFIYRIMFFHRLHKESEPKSIFR